MMNIIQSQWKQWVPVLSAKTQRGEVERVRGDANVLPVCIIKFIFPLHFSLQMLRSDDRFSGWETARVMYCMKLLSLHETASFPPPDLLRSFESLIPPSLCHWVISCRLHHIYIYVFSSSSSLIVASQLSFSCRNEWAVCDSTRARRLSLVACRRIPFPFLRFTSLHSFIHIWKPNFCIITCFPAMNKFSFPQRNKPQKWMPGVETSRIRPTVFPIPLFFPLSACMCDDDSIFEYMGDRKFKSRPADTQTQTEIHTDTNRHTHSVRSVMKTNVRLISKSRCKCNTDPFFSSARQSNTSADHICWS